jgi:catechol 2,3-dioxygenase-like lactoylglutathione lyase family enzyme
MVERTDSGARAPSVGWHLLALRIGPDERTAWLDRLAAHDVTVEGTSDFTIYFSDPDGNRLGLSSWPNPAA